MKKTLSEKDIKKLKPIELKLNKKKPVTEKPKEETEKIEEDLGINNLRLSDEFSDSGVWRSIGFSAPLMSENQDIQEMQEENLEVAASLLAPATTNANNNRIDYATGSNPAGSYSNSSSYTEEMNKRYSNEESREKFIDLGLNDFASRAEIINPFSRSLQNPRQSNSTEASMNLRSELESFARQQEKYKLENEERQKLPFQHKARKREIFK